MPKFTYTVKDANGKSITDVLEAFDKVQVVQELQRRGLYIVNIQEIKVMTVVSPVPGGGPKKFTHSGIKLEDQIIFARQLTTMLEAGVTLLRSLDVIVSQCQSERFYKILSGIKRDVEQGSSLSGALEKHPKVFNQFWVSLVEVGEASGTMPIVLNKLAFYLEQQAAFQATIVSAIIYPAILFIASLGAIAFFALVVGPKFESVFSSMNIELPVLTKVLLAIFRVIQEKIIIIIISLAVLTILIRQYSQTYHGRVQVEKILFSVPQLGEVYKLIVIERFTSQMAILIDSGVPILYALDIAQRLVNNHTCSLIIADIKESVRQGKTLVGPMQKSGFFPPLATQMILVGEETGELSKMLKHVAAFYQSTVETFMKRLGTIIEPVMLLFMGVIIGVIILAMFLPMFNLTKMGGG